eukprot:2777501-Heterocapsa_arctica.AAC.1
MKAMVKTTTRSMASARTIREAARRTDARSRSPAVRPRAPGAGRTSRACSRSRSCDRRRVGEMCPTAGSTRAPAPLPFQIQLGR